MSELDGPRGPRTGRPRRVVLWQPAAAALVVLALLTWLILRSPSGCSSAPSVPAAAPRG